MWLIPKMGALFCFVLCQRIRKIFYRTLRTNVTFIRNKFMIFMFCAIVFLDNFLVQLVINMGA